ncbi:MAG: cyclic nucleotide-binding domain-containing protein [Deltaproteobacteria bacterium]|nr:cyclic nucleotide-binding domain-containing protein [Deltaproteobacteria bacterium]
MSDIVALLMDSPLNQVLSLTDAQALAKVGTERSVSRGKYLFRAGDPGDALFLVAQGSFEVVLGRPQSGETVVATVSAGQIVGELEVMTKTQRVASLLAVDDTDLLELPAAKLEQLLQQNLPAANKLVAFIAKTLARRLAAVNQRILAKPPPPPPADAAPVEVADADLVVDDEDMAVLDKLWG